MGLFYGGSRSGIKEFPLRRDGAQFCIVALRSPTDDKWYGFAPRTMLYGAAADVLRYN